MSPVIDLPAPRRIVSLVPNATEIVFALGAGDRLVGVSHECDFPPEARQRPILTGSALPANLDAAAIDAAVSSQLATGASLYTLDEATISRLEPDLIFTQELCPVCAVSTAQVEGAVAALPRCPDLISLDPKTLEHIFRDIVLVGERIGLSGKAHELVASLEARLAAVAARRRGKVRRRIAALEWLDPPFVAGHWVPEMIAAAGADDAFARPGDASRRLGWDEVAAAEPDLIVVMPCGFDEAGARAQLATLNGHSGWERLSAVRRGRVLAVDANGHWSRPGPRVVDGIEHLAEFLERFEGLG